MLREITIRRSARAFSNREIDEDIINEILEAGRWAPSCYNNQPWHFIVLIGDETEKIHGALNKGNYWAKKAPLVIAVVAKRENDCISDGREYFLFDSGLAVENMLLESYHQGLVAHSILGFNESMVKDALNIPGDFRVLVLVIIGYEGDLNELDEYSRQKELASRNRKKLTEIIHRGGW